MVWSWFVPPGDDAANATKVDSDSRPRTGTYHVPPSPSLVIHGISLYVLSRGPTVRYLVPGLRVIVTTTGPLGRPVLDTLSFSPRAVVMSKGALATPRTWRWQEFGGVRFATPATWPTQRTNLFTQCRSFVALGGRKVVAYSSQTVIEPDNPVVELDTDRTRYTGSCVFGNFQEYAAWRRRSSRCPRQVGQGPTFPNPVYRFTTSQCLRLHGLTACPGTSLSYSILVLKVTVPGRSKPVYVSIGLAGNGMIARTILYSLRASPAIGHPLQVAGTSPEPSSELGVRPRCPVRSAGASDSEKLGWPQVHRDRRQERKVRAVRVAGELQTDWT